MPTPSSTVSIATRGNPGLAVDAVRSILAGVVLPDQLIVVDQSASLDDRMSALARDKSIELIHSRTVGLSVARNIAVEAATGEVILFTDDDVLVDPYWVVEMIAALDRGGARAVATGRVLAADEEAPGRRAVALAISPDPAVYRGWQDRDVLSGNSMGFHRSTFDDCGAFDELLGPGGLFGSADDNDYGYRVLRAGYEIHYVPQAIVYHRARRSDRELAQTMRRDGRGQGAFLMKHAVGGDALMRKRLRRALTWWLRRIATRPMRKRRLKGHGDLKYLAAFLKGAGGWWLNDLRTRRSH